jgi:hypothetical protein
MYEWLLLRLLMLAILVGGGVLFALAATVVERWRERRARAPSARPGEAIVSKHCGNLTELDRLREQHLPAGSARGNFGQKYRVDLAHSTSLRTAAH